MDDFYDAFLGCNDTKKFKGIHHFFGNRPILQLPQIFELPLKSFQIDLKDPHSHKKQRYLTLKAEINHLYS